MKAKRYEKVKRPKTIKMPVDWFYEAGYATDPKYSQKLIDIIEGYKLYEYDKSEGNPISLG